MRLRDLELREDWQSDVGQICEAARARCALQLPGLLSVFRLWRVVHILTLWELVSVHPEVRGLKPGT